jgi:hypothetical protein
MRRKEKESDLIQAQPYLLRELHLLRHPYIQNGVC